MLADRCRSTRARTLSRAAEVFVVAYNRQAVAAPQPEENGPEQIKPKVAVAASRLDLN